MIDINIPKIVKSYVPLHRSTPLSVIINKWSGIPYFESITYLCNLQLRTRSHKNIQIMAVNESTARLMLFVEMKEKFCIQQNKCRILR